MFPHLAERLARSGVTAVSYNTSGSGVDDRGSFSLAEPFRRNTFAAELADLEKMAEAVRGGRLGFAQPSSLGVVGHSRGGGVSILAAAEGLVDVLVTWAAVSTIRRWSQQALDLWRRRGQMDITNSRTGQVLPIGTDLLDEIEQSAEGRFDIVAAAEKVTAPWLLIHGTEDPTVPWAEAEALARAAQAAQPLKLLAIGGAGHTFGAGHPLATVSPELEQVVASTVSWFGRHL